MAASKAFKIGVILNNENSNHQALLSHLLNEFESVPTQSPKISLDIFSGNSIDDWLALSHPDMLVSVGTMASMTAVQKAGNTPLLSVLIPRVSFESIKDKYRSESPALNEGRVSAIYLDQPFVRRFALIKYLMPYVADVGIVLGPSTKHHKSSLVSAAKAYGLKLNIDEIQNNSQLVPSLEDVLKRSQVMLAVLDPLVFNRSNAQTVLLTAYRYRIPIIGISPAYIDAGALAAVYSTPKDIGQQLATEIRRYRKRGNAKLSSPQYPDNFSVRVNESFAHKLGIKTVDYRQLNQFLMKNAGKIK